jgi:nitroreductase
MSTQPGATRQTPPSGPQTVDGAAPDSDMDERMQALEDAADAAMLAPSVHGSQPWTIVVHRDRMELRADRSRQLMAVDPSGRELVQSLGAALFNERVALAARGWAVEIDRFPRPDDPDLAAVVRPVPGAPETRLPMLADAVHLRRTHRAGFLAEEVPDELLDHLTAAAAAEDGALVPVLSDGQRRLIAQLTREADAIENGSSDCRADVQRWRAEPAIASPTDPAAGPARRTVDSDSGEDRTFLLITSRSDDPLAWLRSGEALERLLLELTRLGWAASPMTQTLEVPMTRARLRSGVTGESHPQMLLRIGFAEARPDIPRRHRDDVVSNSARAQSPVHPDQDRRLMRGGAGGPTPVAHRPVTDGRGGTTWI